MKNTSISTKILLAFAGIAVVAVGSVGYFSYTVGRSALEADSFNQLTAVREMKASQLEDYFGFIRDQVITLAEDRMTVEAMIAFGRGFRELADQATFGASDEQELLTYYDEEFLPRLKSYYPSRNLSVATYLPGGREGRILQHLYISANPYSVGSKHFLSSPGDGSSYSRTHELYHPLFRDYLERFGYYDIFLVDARTGGRIVYTVFKEVDFGTSLVDGPYRNSKIAEAYRAALELHGPGTAAIVDFGAYAPSYGAPAAFIAAPVYSGDTKIGVLIFQLPVEKINAIMTNNENWAAVGLGQSGETYVVGSDFTLRNQSRFLLEDAEAYFRMIEGAGLARSTVDRIQSLNSAINLQVVRTQGTEAALSGESGLARFPDYRGVPVLSAYRPLDIEGLRWVIMSEIDEEEAFRPIGELARRIALAVGGLLLAVILASLGFARSLTRPLQSLTGIANQLADGNLDVHVDFTDQRDEIGTLASSFDVMRMSMKDLVAELQAINQNLERKVQERTKELELAERKASSIIDTAGDAILVIDENSHILQWNRSAEKMFGYTAHEMNSQSVLQLMPDRHSSQHRVALDKALKSGKLAHPGKVHEVSGLRRDGSEFPIELSLSHWMIGDEHYFSGIVRDVTERRLLEQQLQEANKRMSVELNFAREIQMSMVPLIFPAFPARSEFSIYGKLIPAREVGGDFYDFYFIDNDHLCFVIGDVSGKGAAGALLMAVTKTLVKSRAMDDHAPSSILTHVNDELSRDNKASMFVTVFLGILNIRTGYLEYTNAGHNPPFIKRADGGVEKVDAFHGPIIGAMPNLTYKQDSATLEKHDFIALYTDGVTEAMDESERLFTEARYKEVICQRDVTTAQKLVDQTILAVKRHEGKAEQSDDITVLAVQFNGASDVEERGRLKLSLRNQTSEMEVLEHEFEAFARGHGIPDEARQKVSVVLDELLNNVISYAYRDEDPHTIEVEFVLTGNRLVTTIRDDGVPFNPFGLEPPEINLAMEERKVGGLGIHLVRSLMDEYFYHRQIGKNVVTLAKVINN